MLAAAALNQMALRRAAALEAQQRYFSHYAMLISGRKLVRRLFVTCDVFTRHFFVAFPWLFRGPHMLRKTVFGRFSWLFRDYTYLSIISNCTARCSYRDRFYADFGKEFPSQTLGRGPS